MTTNEYWQNEIRKACAADPDIGPEIVAALLIAGQLRSIIGTLDEIRIALQHIEESINNQ